jgi:TolB protein
MSFRCLSAKIKWSVALPVMILLLSSCGINGFVRSSPEFQITNNPYYQYRPAISGSYVVWQDERNDNSDIYGYNLGTREEFQITNNPHDQYRPAISGSYVVWEDNRNGNADIYGYNLETREEFRITWDSSDQRYPEISGNLVVWQDERDHTNWEIYGFDLSTNQEIRITKNEYDQKSPKVSGNTVVWIDKRSGKETIYGYDLLIGQEFQVLRDDFSGGIALCDDIVVFQEQAHGDIFTCAYRISTGKKIQIETGYCLTLDLQGSVIVWSQIHSGDSEPYLRSEILGYDLSTDRLLHISSGSRIMMFPEIYGDIVVWQDDRNGNADIYGCTIDGVPSHIVHPRPPLEYYYGLLSVLSVLGGFS